MSNFVDLAPDISIFKKQWLSLEQAIHRVAKFEREFGKAHLSLACHAALPSILTPELVNLIRINFLEKTVEWIAESDLLLSSLCLPIDQGIFEIEPQIRQVLLVALQSDVEYGIERLEEIAYLLHFYNESPLASKIPIYIKRTYQWISSAYLDPDITVQNMFDFLNNTVLEETASRVANYQQVGKTLAMLANSLEMTNLQVELEDLSDSTHLVLYGYEDKENLPMLLRSNLNDIDQTTQVLTSSVVDWLIDSEAVNNNDATDMLTHSKISSTENISTANTRPVTIFCSYSHKDYKLLKELEKHLTLLKRQGLISYWYDRMVAEDMDLHEEIDKHLNSAHIILLLISPDFLASEYCYSIEMKRALERHKIGEAQVLPILLRLVDWRETPFAHLQALPTNGKSIMNWRNKAGAFVNVVEGIRRAIEDVRIVSVSTSQATFPAPFPKVWNIPYRRNSFFTGRDEVITQLHDQLHIEQTVNLAQPIAISGLGGIGKTQVAVEYAYQYRHEYQAVLWMRADSQETLISSYAEIATLLKLREWNEQDQNNDDKRGYTLVSGAYKVVTHY